MLLNVVFFDLLQPDTKEKEKDITFQCFGGVGLVEDEAQRNKLGGLGFEGWIGCKTKAQGGIRVSWAR